MKKKTKPTDRKRTFAICGLSALCIAVLAGTYFLTREPEREFIPASTEAPDRTDTWEDSSAVDTSLPSTAAKESTQIQGTASDNECGHILFSDFTMLDTYHQALSGGRFYPQEPEDLSAKQAKSLREIGEFLEEKDEAVLTALSNIAHSLVNMMEDVYIEGRMCDAFPGGLRTGILLNNLRFAEEMDSVTEEISQQHHEVFIVANLLIQYAKTGDINNLDGYKGPYLDTVYECIPYIDDAAYDDDARVRFDAANKMLLLLWPYMESYIRQVREDIKNHTDIAGTELGEQLAGGAPLPGGRGKPVSGRKGKHDPGNDEEDRIQLQQVLDYEDGRIELEKTDEIGEDADGGTSRTSDYAGSGYVSQAAEDMERIMAQLAEDAAYASYEQELSEELQAESDRIRYGNAHKGVHVNINRMAYVDPSYMEAYQKVAPPLLLISKRLQKQVSQILKDYREGGKLDNRNCMMKNKKDTIKCSGCQYCSGFRPYGNTRTSFTCSHPDQGYIQDYFHEKGMSKMPCFLGFGARHSDAVPVKTAPAWCPEKKAAKEK